GREQFGDPARGQVGQVDRDHDRRRQSDHDRDGRGDQGAVDERPGTVGSADLGVGVTGVPGVPEEEPEEALFATDRPGLTGGANDYQGQDEQHGGAAGGDDPLEYRIDDAPSAGP